MRKRCSGCNISKPLSRFHVDNSGKYGVQSQCKPCRSVKIAAHKSAKKNADPIGYRAARTAERYGVSKEDVLSFWSIPVCQSCGAALTGKNLRIDHCHEFGHVRGIVCHPCNMALAGTHDECMHRLHSAISYLRRDAERRHEQG